MEIKEFVIHRIEKAANTDPTTHCREGLLPADDERVVNFTRQTVEVFTKAKDKPSSIYADFHEDTENYPFSRYCREFLFGQIEFLEYSRKATERLAARMISKPSAVGGYVVFAHFLQGGARHLMVLMVHKAPGFSIDDQTLTFLEVNHLDLKQINKAALINGGANGASLPPRPLTYAGFRTEMSLYFQEFLGPDRFRNPNKESRELIQAVDQFSDLREFDQGRRDNIRMSLRAYALQAASAGGEIDLAAVSAMVCPEDPDAFRLFANGDKKISGSLKPDPAVFNKWRIIRHKSPDGLIQLQIRAEAINNRVFLDDVNHTLTITNIEEELASKIKAQTNTNGAQ